MEPEAAPSAPSQEPEAAPAATHPVPWEDAGLNRFQGLGRTLGQVLFHPGDFFRTMPREGWAEALAFALIVGTAGMLACLYWQLLLYLGLSRAVGVMRAMPCLFSRVEWALIPMMLLTPVVMLANLIVSSLGLWGAVGLTGGPWSVFSPVWRITCYAQGAMVAGFLPLLGGPVAGLWTLVLYYRGLQKVLGLSSWRALGVLCLSLVLQVLLVVLLLGSLWGFRLLLG
ncbi:MAG: YIP1 family protein [Deltaproteobacteria bacterium]|nr:YIP1 family protein [Deltaproteobacteria bacterium]